MYKIILQLLQGKILGKQNELFGDTFDSIVYYYPEYLDEAPVA